ncbi:MAG: Txe/YoeB family addiction module toxin [Colwellia sp.]|nr:Txe/YoeB family addiction module toxin [Colwellia sp.]
MANIKKKLDSLDSQVDKRKLVFTKNGWQDYQYWRTTDQAKFTKLNELIEAAQVSLHSGIGKPERLTSNLKGYYSRRIDREHRLIYKSVNGDLVIFAARFHY